MPTEITEVAAAGAPSIPVVLETNPQIERAERALAHGDAHVLIMGRAGTGKSTLLRRFLEFADLKSTVVLAPTGVAALNVGGETIHRFLGLQAGATADDARERAAAASKQPKRAELYRRLTSIIIDEISMVRADLLDALDVFLREVRGRDVAFGGVRLIAFGDLYQLPPVVAGKEERELFKTFYTSPYFFDSQVFTQLRAGVADAAVTGFPTPLDVIELTQVYRQRDPEFLNFLNKVRSRDLQADDLEFINARVVDDVNDDHNEHHDDDHDNEPHEQEQRIHITVTNARAEQINAEHLAHLPGPSSTFHAHVSPDFPRTHEPTAIAFELRPGAQVMMLTNDPADRWVNGTLGTVVRIIHDDSSGYEDDSPEVVVRLETGATVRVEQYTWEAVGNAYDPAAGRIIRTSLGTFTQMPMRLAWAATIHKSQGKTFDRVTVDFERATFAHGQAYVALSRARTLGGVRLARPMKTSDVRLDRSVVKFLTGLQVQLEKHRNLMDRLAAGGTLESASIEGVLADAILHGASLHMVYVKSDNTRTERVITPVQMGQMKFGRVVYDGLVAYCHTRGEQRSFRIDQIVSLTPASMMSSCMA